MEIAGSILAGSRRMPKITPVAAGGHSLCLVQLISPDAEQRSGNILWGNHMGDVIQQIKGGLIVSCQALEDEPLHGPILMGAMAFAAKEGGAAGIRAMELGMLRVIKAMTGLPVIGIDKRLAQTGGCV